MAAPEGHDPIPIFRNKRRKIEHRRIRLDQDDEAPSSSVVRVPETAIPGPDHDALATSTTHDAVQDSDKSTPNLKEILRMRKRPQDRLREAARKAAPTPQPTPSTAFVPAENARSSDPYATRFVAQTGQVVDKDDKQMMAYIEAKMAEKKYQQYGWPLPSHISSSPFAASIPTTPSSSDQLRTRDEKPEKEERLTASKGMLEEVELSTSSWQNNTAGVREARRKHAPAPATMRNPDSALSGQQPQPAKPPRRRRGPKQKTEEELRREAMVEAVMREAKIDIYQTEPEPSLEVTGASSATADEAMLEQFRREYLESVEEQRRPPPAPPASGAKGVKEEPKGPKLGGSRSARAAMRLQQEAAAKVKR